MLRMSWNPTRAWIESGDPALLLDLDQQRFCGVAIGEPIARLSFLGPASRWSHALEFPGHGLALGGEERIEQVSLFFGHADEPEQGRYRGGIVHRGASAALSCNDDEPRLAALFGEPFWRDADADETILFYEFGVVEWQIELGSDGRLKCLSLSRPLLADPAQRAAYGVSRPWPPEPAA